MKRWMWMAGLCALVVGGIARGDVVEMSDGTVRTGTVIRKTDDEVFLRIDREGIKATVGLPAKSVVRIVKGEEKAATASAPAGVMAVPPGAAIGPAVVAPAVVAPLPAVKEPLKVEAATRGVRRSAPMLTELPATKGFLLELAASAIGAGPSDPRRLPPELKELWDEAVRQSKGHGNRVELLESLRLLDDAFSPIAGGMERLEAICQRERGESFGPWLARVHWEAVSENYAGGRFELGDVREVEKKTLIGVLKEKTGPALEPLRSYFPPVDAKTGKAEGFKPSQLAGITVGNALDVKKKAAYASAVLLAQLKLEPEMPVVDKLFIGGQLTTVRRVLGRAMELEPAARAAAEKERAGRK